MIRRFVFTVSITCAAIETGFAQSSTAEPVPTAEARTGLPACVNSPSDIAQIQAIQKANSRTPRKYDGYRAVFDATPDLELAARLAYAETVAANCPGNESLVADLVTSVIGNRVRIRSGDVRSIVFQRDQFASSLNIYPESRYRDFLCPGDSELWNEVHAKTRANLEHAQPAARIPRDAVNYYLYRHSDRLTPPRWNLEEVATPGEKTRDCIRVFRAPAWK